MKVLVTGGAGFIGSHLIDRLLLNGDRVTCVDNYLLGKKLHLGSALKNENFYLHDFDLIDVKKLESLFEREKFDIIYHLAANSDIKLGFEDSQVDFDNTLTSTLNVLNCMKKYDSKKIVFASSSAIYGDNNKLLSEEMGPLLPISNYGAAKLASEAYISSFSNNNNFCSMIVRFPNVIGFRLTHGVIYDFINRLELNPKKLFILGDGNQKKPYLYINDLLDAIGIGVNNLTNGINVYNVAPNSLSSVKFIAKNVIDLMKLKGTDLKYAGGRIGWVGDIPTFSYDTSKINNLGWRPNYSSDEAIIKSIEMEIQYRSQIIGKRNN